MHAVSTFFGAALTLLTLSTAAAKVAYAETATLDIRVEAGTWGNARPGDIEAVLYSVVDALGPSFSRQGTKISVAYSDDGPRVLLDRSADGSHRVFLKVRDARWDQFTYQFSHELCHIFTNHEHREMAPGVITRDHQWFEETLCEAVSLYTLERMACLLYTSRCV